MSNNDLLKGALDCIDYLLESSEFHESMNAFMTMEEFKHLFSTGYSTTEKTVAHRGPLDIFAYLRPDLLIRISNRKGYERVSYVIVARALHSQEFPFDPEVDYGCLYKLLNPRINPSKSLETHLNKIHSHIVSRGDKNLSLIKVYFRYLEFNHPILVKKLLQESFTTILSWKTPQVKLFTYLLEKIPQTSEDILKIIQLRKFERWGGDHLPSEYYRLFLRSPKKPSRDLIEEFLLNNPFSPEELEIFRTEGYEEIIAHPIVLHTNFRRYPSTLKYLLSRFTYSKEDIDANFWDYLFNRPRGMFHGENEKNFPEIIRILKESLQGYEPEGSQFGFSILVNERYSLVKSFLETGFRLDNPTSALRYYLIRYPSSNPPPLKEILDVIELLVARGANLGEVMKFAHPSLKKLLP